MMRIGLLKRIESSPFALRRSLENYRGRLASFETMLDKGYIMSFGDIAELTYFSEKNS